MTGPQPFQRRVFDGTHLRALHFTSGHRKLLVTFDYRTIGKSDFPAAQTTHAFDVRGYDQLRIQSRANDWFLNADTPALEAALAPLAAPYRKVRMIGYSMGGYGAFRFAATLRATHIFAVSPQVSLDESVAPFEYRYPDEARGFDPDLGDIAARARPACEGFMVVDPFDSADMRHAHLLQELFPRIGIVRLGFGGHPATDVVTGARQGFPVQRASIMESPDARFVHAAHRTARRLSPPYWRALAARAAPRRPVLANRARAEADRLADLLPTPT